MFNEENRNEISILVPAAFVATPREIWFPLVYPWRTPQGPRYTSPIVRLARATRLIVLNEEDLNDTNDPAERDPTRHKNAMTETLSAVVNSPMKPN